jgi:hypothetical protein
MNLPEGAPISRIISKEDFHVFINALITNNYLNVIGVKSRKNKFAFGSLEYFKGDDFQRNTTWGLKI